MKTELVMGVLFGGALLALLWAVWKWSSAEDWAETAEEAADDVAAAVASEVVDAIFGDE